MRPHLICLSVLLVFAVVNAQSNDELQKTILSLQKHISQQQHKISAPYFFPFFFQQQKGLYKSYVKLNFFGDEEMRLLRHTFSVPDSNMFVTNFVTLALLEAYELGSIELNQSELEDAVDAIMSYRDKNFGDVPVYCFWPQQKTASQKYWSAEPVNLEKPIKTFGSFSKFMRAFLGFLGLGKLYDKISFVGDYLDMYASVFRIPSDADDSSVNIALGSVLQRNADKFPSIYSQWAQNNKNVSRALELYKKYSYKPFSNDNNHNLIDPRTYYFMRDFLRQNTENTNLTLISTWIMNHREDQVEFPEVSMPLHSNNVDASVNSNVLYGINHFVLSDPEAANQYFDNELRTIYSDIVKLMSWTITSGQVLARPDIALLYYPSVYDFYWFVARNSFLLSSQANLPFPEMEFAKSELSSVLKNVATKQILQLAQSDSQKGYLYWDDFLGQADNEAPSGEDRLFSTAMSLNTLLDTWTQADSVCKRKWSDGVPQDVVLAIGRAVSFINAEVLSGTYAPDNAFFSASYKGNSSLPYFYPGNFIQYLNGTPVDMHHIDTSQEIVYDMAGYVDDDIYQKWLNMTWYGSRVPTKFEGFNSGVFPYWSAPAMTHSMSLLALAKYSKVQACA